MTAIHTRPASYGPLARLYIALRGGLLAELLSLPAGPLARAYAAVRSPAVHLPAGRPPDILEFLNRSLQGETNE